MTGAAFEEGKSAKKILVIGSVSAGKTTFARRLCRETGIPYYELDLVVYEGEGESRRKRMPEQQMELLRQIDLSGAWILEGTLRDSYSEILAWAETIVFLDPPLPLRKTLIFLRFVKQRLGVEPCHYKPDFKMLRLMYKWTREFEAARPAFEARLKAFDERVVRVKSLKEYSVNKSAELLGTGVS